MTKNNTFINDIVKEDVYKYSAIFCATTFLIPQIVLSYTTKSMKDISISSLIIISIGSSLWGLYLYEYEQIIYLFATVLVLLTSIILLSMSVSFYYNRVNEHWKSFDKPLTPIIAAEKNTV